MQVSALSSKLGEVQVLGATGLVGSALVRLLLDLELVQVTALGRRGTGEQHPRLRERLLDFENASSFGEQIHGQALVSALGTTLKTAGSQDAQWKVDYQYQLEVARAARQNGVSHYVLVSSTGANPQARVFYSRMKGQLEDAIQSLGFSSLTILRPGILDGERVERRPGERAALGVLRSLPQALLPASARPVPVRTVGAAAIAGLCEGEGTRVWEAAQIFERGASYLSSRNRFH